MLNMSSLTHVPMNTKILLGLTLVAVLAMTVASPVVAEAITGIKKTEIKVKDGEIDKLKFHLDEKLPDDVFGGYAILTDHGAVVAITKHPGFYDSVAQEPPTDAQVEIQVGAIAAKCTTSVDACGGEWHSHLVEPAASGYCDFAAVGELTFNEPAEKVKAKKKHVEAKHIDLGDEKFVGAVSGEYRDFTVGTPIDGGVAFDLIPAVSPAGLKAICIMGVSEDPAGLCAELGSATGGAAFRDTHNVVDGGDDTRVELDEFPYNDALWTDANIYNPDTTGVGPGELDIWYAANCVAP